MSGYICLEETEAGQDRPSKAFVFMDWNSKAGDEYKVQIEDSGLVLGKFNTSGETTVNGFGLKYWQHRRLFSVGEEIGLCQFGLIWRHQITTMGQLYENIGFTNAGFKSYPFPIDFYNEGLLRCFSHPQLGQLQFSDSGAIVPNTVDFCERILVSRNKRHKKTYFSLLNNPVTDDILLLESYSELPNVKAEVYTVQGAKVFSGNYQERLQLPEAFPAGIYNLHLSTPDQKECTSIHQNVSSFYNFTVMNTKNQLCSFAPLLCCNE